MDEVPAGQVWDRLGDAEEKLNRTLSELTKVKKQLNQLKEFNKRMLALAIHDATEREDMLRICKGNVEEALLGAIEGLIEPAQQLDKLLEIAVPDAKERENMLKICNGDKLNALTGAIQELKKSADSGKEFFVAMDDTAVSLHLTKEKAEERLNLNPKGGEVYEVVMNGNKKRKLV